ncbi:MAG: hypothetical protein MJZ26_09235 [Fibrobacter sp.]|nr:hypothetical protein [Fibrobacter sp.]
MTITEIKKALEKRGYHLEKAVKMPGAYNIVFKKTKIAYLYNQPTKGNATIQMEDCPERPVYEINKPEDLFWYIP